MNSIRNFLFLICLLGILLALFERGAVYSHKECDIKIDYPTSPRGTLAMRNPNSSSSTKNSSLSGNSPKPLKCPALFSHRSMQCLSMTSSGCARTHGLSLQRTAYSRRRTPSTRARTSCDLRPGSCRPAPGSSTSRWRPG